MDHRYAGAARRDIYNSVDEKLMQVEVTLYTDNDDEELISFPFRYIACPTCDGKGSHVNPSVDSNGITSDEWDEWGYEEREDYMNGIYDVTCFECSGKRVVPEVDEDRCSDELKSKLKLWRDQVYEMGRSAAEDRRAWEMGY